MGACVSVAKSMKGEAGGAPPPEPPKEDITTEVAEVKAADKEVTVEGEEEDKPRSLASLLDESEEVKESPETKETTETEGASSETVKAEEQKPEAALPVSDEAACVAPVAHATEEEK